MKHEDFSSKKRIVALKNVLTKLHRRAVKRRGTKERYLTYMKKTWSKRDTIEPLYIQGRAAADGNFLQTELAKLCFKYPGIATISDSAVVIGSDTIYPDICLVKHDDNGEMIVVAIIEVKLDLGYWHESESFIRRYRSIAGKPATIRVQYENPNEDYLNLRISKNCFMGAVIATLGNSHNRFDKFKETLVKAGFPSEHIAVGDANKRVHIRADDWSPRRINPLNLGDFFDSLDLRVKSTRV